ncbi:polymorphic toxin type 50 domain-containing protein [Marilutibacter maris]|uniref:polymorphic toxin type 50 domain-containing protein n=1 Tax=Marilutibacter maris TaxID=1605891 RepID=UPI001CB9750E|nr:polymorphic toxin type 50 domain-containing protein [Lysobacter maris]
MRNWLLTILLWTIALGLPAQAQTVTYVHTDALGSPVVETDANRNVIERNEYEPYGRSNQPLDDAPAYTGHVGDAATGLIYAQQRYYDDDIGRFLSVDPVTAHSDPIGMFNRYKYAANNPYGFKDPDGRQECRSCELGYGGVTSMMLTPEQRRVWAIGERAATTAGSGAEEGAAIMDGVREFIANPEVTREGITRLAIAVAMARLTHGKSAEVMHGPSPNIKLGHQGKHQVGDNNYRPGRSILTGDPAELGRYAGTGRKVGDIEVGRPGSKERVNFGREIGYYVDRNGNAISTTNGIIHYGKAGIHIVPSRPD